MVSQPDEVTRAPFDVQQGVLGVTQPVLARRPESHPGTVAATIVGIVLAALALLVVFAYLALALGVIGVIVAGLLALVPLAIVLLAVSWIDRWEPEPRAAWVFCLLWGAGVSVLIALIVDGEVQSVIAALGGGDGAVFFQAVVQAPIVEEAAKGLGVLLIFLIARRHFDGPVDGVVYAALTASGFAFTENIQYFGVALAEGGAADVAGTFFVRGIMSPFAHVMFTALIGIAIGLAARRGSAVSGSLAFVGGLVPAVLLHAFWNGALFAVGDFLGYYALVQVPLFAVAVGIVLYLRSQERRITFDRLSEYAAVGWFNQAEIPALATAAGRRQARAWARSHGLAEQMGDYLRFATRLAFVRHRIVSGRAAPRDIAHESALLRSVVAARRALQAPAFPR